MHYPILASSVRVAKDEQERAVAVVVVADVVVHAGSAAAASAAVPFLPPEDLAVLFSSRTSDSSWHVPNLFHPSVGDNLLPYVGVSLYTIHGTTTCSDRRRDLRQQ